MITGDYHHTAISVAKGAGMIPPAGKLVIIQAAAEAAKPFTMTLVRGSHDRGTQGSARVSKSTQHHIAWAPEQKLLQHVQWQLPPQHLVSPPQQLQQSVPEQPGDCSAALAIASSSVDPATQPVQQSAAAQERHHQPRHRKQHASIRLSTQLLQHPTTSVQQQGDNPCNSLVQEQDQESHPGRHLPGQLQQGSLHMPHDHLRDPLDQPDARQDEPTQNQHGSACPKDPCAGLLFTCQGYSPEQEPETAHEALQSMAQGQAQCCVTGQAFDHMLQCQDPAAVLDTVMQNAAVFARMRSHQKGQVMELLSSRG